MSVTLITLKSKLLNVGPVITLRPRFPKLGTGVSTEVLNHWSTSPKTSTGPFTSGRSVLATPLTVLFDVTTLNGLPLCDCTTAPSCQPETNRFPWKGSSQIELSTKLSLIH